MRENYFNRRLEELIGLFDKSASKTSGELIKQAMALTKKADTENNRVHKIALEGIAKYDLIFDKFKAGRETMQNAIEQIRASSATDVFSGLTKAKILDAADAMLMDAEAAFEDRKYANRSVRHAIEFCDEQLTEVLRTLIFRPNPTNFRFDAAVAILSKIVTGWIPYSDKGEIVLEACIKRRKNNYLSTGDKILIYLEDYITVVDTWLSLNYQFEKDVLN